ncbi:MAG: hypothetical protein ACRD4L_00650 [Pyrinomonadaceae bacterium]
MITNVQEIYHRHLASLSNEDRLRLLTILANSLTELVAPQSEPPRSLLELEGLGADIWQEEDAQEYVYHLRNEWEQRS